MRIFGFKWAKAEYEWLSGRITDYIIGWKSGCADRRAIVFRTPEYHIDEAHLYMGET